MNNNYTDYGKERIREALQPDSIALHVMEVTRAPLRVRLKARLTGRHVPSGRVRLKGIARQGGMDVIRFDVPIIDEGDTVVIPTLRVQVS